MNRTSLKLFIVWISVMAKNTIVHDQIRPNRRCWGGSVAASDTNGPICKSGTASPGGPGWCNLAPLLSSLSYSLGAGSSRREATRIFHANQGLTSRKISPQHARHWTAVPV